MKKRCYYTKNENYSRYGGNGIKVCNEWKNNFNAFYNWAIKNGYNENLTIDRIDSSGDYCPANCRWSSYYEQNQHQKHTLIYEYNGEKLSISELAKKYGLNRRMLKARFDRGWSVERAITQPVQKKNCDNRKQL